MKLATRLSAYTLALVATAGVVYTATRPDDELWVELTALSASWNSTGPLAIAFSCGGEIEDEISRGGIWRHRCSVPPGTRVAVHVAASKGPGAQCEIKRRDVRVVPPPGEPLKKDARIADCEAVVEV